MRSFSRCLVSNSRNFSDSVRRDFALVLLKVSLTKPATSLSKMASEPMRARMRVPSQGFSSPRGTIRPARIAGWAEPRARSGRRATWRPRRRRGLHRHAGRRRLLAAGRRHHRRRHGIVIQPAVRHVLRRAPLPRQHHGQQAGTGVSPVWRWHGQDARGTPSASSAPNSSQQWFRNVAARNCRSAEGCRRRQFLNARAGRQAGGIIDAALLRLQQRFYLGGGPSRRPSIPPFNGR